MISFIIQARCGSTRLPNKILLPFYNGKSILDLLLDKLSAINGTNVVVATTTNANDDAIVSVAEKHGIACFRGSETDVLDRFISAAEFSGAQQIIRVCSDNPFLDVDSIEKLKEAVDSNPDADYISFDVKGTPSIKTHYGFWTEYVTLDALKKVRALTKDAIYHEHVTNYIYSHPEQFKIVWIMNAGTPLKNFPIRLTTDTKKDFLTAQKIYSSLIHLGIRQTIPNIVDYLSNQPDIIMEMETEILKNSK
ncbi:NTP transferase domain-containing protein [uncultured Alistipes sp.]|uniref:cytidylyltransferase domain-containing protein n=1 Tax=uncultured Alistipes sp. TaxID=538949 RepID=UPI0026108796|nr:NTP transferase domain-containing protein [uncultured Alistipes sp.]